MSAGNIGPILTAQQLDKYFSKMALSIKPIPPCPHRLPWLCSFVNIHPGKTVVLLKSLMIDIVETTFRNALTPTDTKLSFAHK